MQKFGSGGTNKSKDLLYILDCQNEIDDAVNVLDQRIYYLETLYLEEANTVGNIIKGWDLLMDKYPKAAPTSKKGIQGEERIFSGTSSYYNDLDDEKSLNYNDYETQSAQVRKRKRKRESRFDDDDDEDVDCY